MDSSRKKSLLLLITNSYAAINIIHSGLIKPLALEYDIQLVSSLIGKIELSEINKHFDIQMQQIQVPLFEESYLLRFLRQLEKAVFFHHFRIETQKIKDQQSSILYRCAVDILLSLIASIRLTSGLLKLLRKIIILLTGKNLHVKSWNLPDFDGVISTSPLDIRENTIVNHLKIKGTPSLAIVISWDNLTSKGIINANHDYVLVWNQYMAQEYDLFYKVFNITKQKIFITGVPRFDVYYKPLPPQYTAESIRKKFNIPNEHKLILFATSALNHCPNQADILEHLLEYAAHHSSTTILVRCHPADDYRKYSRFENEQNFRIWHSEKILLDQTFLNAIPDLDALLSLASMLKTCDVCIQIASTIRLEAAICNKPCICIAYDGNEILPESHSVKRFYSYSHQIPLNKLGLDHFAYNKPELFLTLDKFLDQAPKIDHTDKIQKFVHHTAPESVAVTMKYIREWLT